MKTALKIIGTVIVVSLLCLIPWGVGNFFTPDNSVVIEWFRGVMCILALAGFSFGVVMIVVYIYEQIKNILE